jgi:hypothetical protein
MSHTSKQSFARDSTVGQSLRRDLVFHQLDDLNALADALAAAARENDAARLAVIRASLDRFALALGWNADLVVPAIIAYLDEHKEFEDDLFGPAFVLGRIAPGNVQSVALLARLPQAVRDLLALAVQR